MGAGNELSLQELLLHTAKVCVWISSSSNDCA